MKTLCVNGADIVSKEQLHEWIAAELQFPAWYGGNLDALYDCLTDYKDELELRISNVSDLKKTLGEDTRRLLRVLEDAAGENEKLRISIE